MRIFRVYFLFPFLRRRACGMLTPSQTDCRSRYTPTPRVRDAGKEIIAYYFPKSREIACCGVSCLVRSGAMRALRVKNGIKTHPYGCVGQSVCPRVFARLFFSDGLLAGFAQKSLRLFALRIFENLIRRAHFFYHAVRHKDCLLYTSDAADE